MPDRLMTRDEIVRRLRLVASGRVRHRPLTMQMIAARCGLSRVAVYNARDGIMGDLVQHLLSHVLREIDSSADDCGRDRDRRPPHRSPTLLSVWPITDRSVQPAQPARFSLFRCMRSKPSPLG
jgi:hypothetical protein